MAKFESKSGDPKDELESRFEFERLISDTSGLLFAAAPEDLERVIEDALENVRIFFRADRCALLSVSEDLERVNVRLDCTSGGVPVVAPDTNLAESFPWSRHRLLVERAPIRVARLEDLPPEAAPELSASRALSIRSALTLPIETQGPIGHLIVLNAVHEERDWPERFVTRVRLLGQMIVGALERKELLNESREAEATMNLAAESAEAGLWKLDFGTRLLWATKRARTILGSTHDEVITIERLEAAVHPDDRDLFWSANQEPVLRNKFVDVEFRIRRSGGDERWISSSGRYQLAPDGSIETLTGISIDVTERKHAREALRLSEARLSSAADLAGLSFYEAAVGEDASYHVDDRFHDLCGLPADRNQGIQPLQFWMEHLHPDDRERVLDQRQQLHDGRLSQVSLEYRYLHPEAGEKWFAHLGRISRRDEAGNAVATFGILRDVTARKRYERELLDLSQRLIQAQEEERGLLARELHDDFTQRLALLAIQIADAESKRLLPAQADVLKSVRDGLARMSEDVHSLAYQLHPSILNELGLVEALRAECERVDRQGRIEISSHLDPLPANVDEDAALCLFRVAQEALGNANRHAGPCKADVILRAMDDGFFLAVRDDGRGFDPARPRTGRSLGLASMRERVRLQNGTLDIETAPGQGTAVIAWVPMEATSR